MRQLTSSVPMWCVIASVLWFGSASNAAPLSPTELRVADTSNANGAQSTEIAAAGISPHPHFRLRHSANGVKDPATKVRVQVSISPEFTSILWDSGFVNVSTTPAGHLTPAVAYAGPALSLEATYYWRAGVQDSGTVSSPFSSVAASFQVVAQNTPCDLRASTGLGSEVLQGNPVETGATTPGFSAEHPGGAETISYAQVETGITADFSLSTWVSDWVSVGSVQPGMRCAGIVYGGPALGFGDARFWRIRFAENTEEPMPWSQAAASILYTTAPPDATSPGGFSGETRAFGNSQHFASDMVVAHVDGNNALDAVVTSGEDSGAHLMYPDIGTTVPGTPVTFGAGRGGRTLAAVADFDYQDGNDVLLVDQFGCLLYLNGSSGLSLTDTTDLTGYGEPTSVHIGDVDWDGTTDVVIAYDTAVVCVRGIFNELPDVFTLVTTTSEAISSLIVADFLEDGQPEIVVLSNGMLSAYRVTYETVETTAEWSFSGITRIAPANPSDATSIEIVCISSTTISLQYLNPDWVWQTEKSDELPRTGNCLGVEAAELTGDSLCDYVVVLDGMTYVAQQETASFRITEYVGHPGGPPNFRVCTADVNNDTFPDIIVGRRGAPHTAYLNKPRLGVSILDTVATQVQFGEAYAVFRVELSAPPESMVEVFCETDEAVSGEPEEDGLPDASGLLAGQQQPWPYVPTTARLVFVPHQYVQYFRVPLTGYYAAPSYNIAARITFVVGAYVVRPSAIGLVFGSGGGGGGSSTTPSTTGFERDWKLTKGAGSGEIHALASANGNTYFGGDFDGVEWAAKGLAAINQQGHRRFALPEITSGEVFAIAVHPTDGSIFIGGKFEISSASGPVRNIARLIPGNGATPTYAVDPNFILNPTGNFSEVRAIDFDSAGRIYFGGSFTSAGGMPVNSVARVSLPQGAASYYVDNSFGVTGGGNGGPRVHALKVSGAHTPTDVSDDFLAVGGQFTSFKIPSWPTPYAVSNLAFVPLSGSYFHPFPRVQGPVVNALAFSYATTTFDGNIHYSPTLIFGGWFGGVFNGTSTAYCNNIGVTNARGKAPIGPPPQSTEIVTSLVVDSYERVWVGRRKQGQNTDPLCVYELNNGVLTPQTAFSSGLNQAVEGLAVGPDEVMAVGGFSSAGVAPPVSAPHLGVFSAGASWGAVKTDKRLDVRSGAVRAAAADLNQHGIFRGYLVAGSFTSFRAERGNLAAIDHNGHLLPWGPRTDGPVRAMVADTSHVYFGGDFTAVNGLSRSVSRALANDVATQPEDWYVKVSGGNPVSVVRALALSGNHIVIGGVFSQVRNTYMKAIAAAHTNASGEMSPDPTWHLGLWGAAGEPEVNSILVDGGRVYVGGRYMGYTTLAQPAFSQPSLLAVTVPGTAWQLEPWDAGLAAGCTVKAIAATSQDIFVAGDFTTIGTSPQTVLGLGALTKDNGSMSSNLASPLATFAPLVNGQVLALTCESDGIVYVGGSFHSVLDQSLQPPVSVERRGLAAFDSTTGLLLDWKADVLNPAQSGEVVRTIVLDGAGSPGELWAGGTFTGTPSVGQYHLASFSRGFTITTAALPPANEGEPYGPILMAVTGNASCTWTISASAAPALTINPSTGEISGTAPMFTQATPPQTMPTTLPVKVTATMVDPPFSVATKWFQIALVAAPPPPRVSISGPGSIVEGDSPVWVVTPGWTISLNMAFSADVRVKIEYEDDTARSGYDFVPMMHECVLPAAPGWPQNAQQIPITLFGNLTPDAPRTFRIRITSLTQGVQAVSPDDVIQVVINDDDNFVPRESYARQVQIREDPNTPAQQLRVVSARPYVAWEFATDFVGNQQAKWQIQLSEVSDFSLITWDSQEQSGSVVSAQLLNMGQSLADGMAYYVRVRVWHNTSQPPSEWTTLPFRTNTPPFDLDTIAMNPSNGATVTTARPWLAWDIVDDAEGDPQHFVVTVADGAAETYTYDSRQTPHLFEQETSAGGSWSTVAQGGVPAGIVRIRIRIPSSAPLSPGSWTWTVDSWDPYECKAGPQPLTFVVDPSYLIEGIVESSTGVPDVGRNITAVLLPGYQPIGTPAVVTTGAAGEFAISVQMHIAPGDLIAVYIDNPVPGGGGGSPAYAAAYIRFPGGDLSADTGNYRKVRLMHGQTSIESRNAGGIRLESLLPPPTPDEDLPFFVQSNELVLSDFFGELHLSGDLTVYGSTALAGEPTVLSVPATTTPRALRISPEGSLVVRDGAHASLGLLDNAGAVCVHESAVLTLVANSQSYGDFTLADSGNLVFDGLGIELEVSGGTFDLGAGSVAGSSSVGTIRLESGNFLAQGTTFERATLDVGPMATPVTVRNLAFTSDQVSRRILWRRTANSEFSMRGINFTSGATCNVEAASGASPLRMIGCGGDQAGEAYDLEPAGEDIVTWEIDEINGVMAYPGDARVLLMWSAGNQTGAGFQFEVLAATQSTGPFSVVGTTGSTFYVDTGTANDVERFYKIKLTAWSSQNAETEVVACTPREPQLETASPMVVSPTGVWPGMAIGAHSHFDASTMVGSSTTGVTIPASGIVTLSATLILFDVETDNAPQGQAAVQIETPSVWSAWVTSTYQEILLHQFEVTPPPSPNYPSVEFLDTGAFVPADGHTSGPFEVGVAFHDNGGAAIDPATFECKVDRDILVGGATVVAGDELARSALALWGMPAVSGATWVVEQQQTTPQPTEELISTGEIVISVRVANMYGFYCSWHHLRIFIEGGQSDQAFISGDLLQNTSDQEFEVTCNDALDSDWVWFPDDPEIVVQSVTQTSTNTFDVTLSAGFNALVGRHSFQVGKRQQPLPQPPTPPTPAVIRCYGTYNLFNDPFMVGSLSGGITTMSMSSGNGTGYPGPRATTGAVGVTLQNGEFRWSSTDIAVEGRSFPIIWDRHYRSARVSEIYPDDGLVPTLGWGWFNTYLQWIAVDDSDFSVTWSGPNGERIFFEAVITSGGTTYRTQSGVAAKATVLKADPQSQFPEQIEIQTSGQVAYAFENYGREHQGKWKYRLMHVRDQFLNKHTLEYLGMSTVPTWINGDTYTRGSNELGHCLKLKQHGNGLIQQVAHVVRRKSDGQAIDTLRSVEYRYDSTGHLTLQRIPDGHRFGAGGLFRGYHYWQTVSTDRRLLNDIYEPSEVTPQSVSPTPPSTTVSWTVQTSSNPLAQLSVSYVSYYPPWGGTEWRVDAQVIGGARSYALTYLTPHWSAGQPVEVEDPAGAKVTYTLNENGQATNVREGTGPYVETKYEYAAGNQQLLSKILPKGNAIHYRYPSWEDPAAVTPFSFHSLYYDYPESGQVATRFTTNLLVIGGVPYPWEHYIGQTVQLRNSSNELVRHAKVLLGSAGALLIVPGDLQAAGFLSGNAAVPNDNLDALTRFNVVQERRSTGGFESSNDLITKYEYEDKSIFGDIRSVVRQVSDPLGRATEIQMIPSFTVYVSPSTYQVAASIVGMTIVTSQTVEGVGLTGIRKVVTTTLLDGYGRTRSEEGPYISGVSPVIGDNPLKHQITEYKYYDESYALQGAVGKLAEAKQTERPDSGAAGAARVTKYEYDNRGFLEKVILPRSAEPGAFQSDQFTTEYKTNDAGQVYMVRHAASGPLGSAQRPETWFYYDKDGREVRRISLYCPILATSASSPASGVQNLPDLQLRGTFSHPFSRRDAGWIHTIYGYNQFGEVESVEQDLDVESNTLVSATTTYDYDNRGLLVKQTTPMSGGSSPKNHVIQYVYDDRGLLKQEITAPNKGEITSAVEFTYDDNGNLTFVKDDLDRRTEHQYDGYDRRTLTLTPVEGTQRLEHRIEYPKYGDSPAYIKEKVGSGDSARETWTAVNAQGDVFETLRTARDKNGQDLHGAVSQGGKPWAVTTTWRDGASRPVETRLQKKEVLTTSFVRYDGFGQVREERSSRNGALLAKYEYDLGGNAIEAQTNQKNPNTSYAMTITTGASYDPADQLWEATDGAGSVVEYLRNNLGWVEEVRENISGTIGRRSETEYDFVGRPRVTQVLGAGSNEVITTETVYNLMGLVVEEKAWRDNKLQITTRKYDEKGRLTHITRPDFGVWEYRYDAVDRVKSERLPDGHLIENEVYDQADNLKQRKITPPEGPVEYELYTYNEFGEMLTAQNLRDSKKLSTLRMEYNSLGLIEDQTLTAYDDDGQEISVKATKSSFFDEAKIGFKSAYYDVTGGEIVAKDWKMAATYDALGREVSLAYWDSRSIGRSYFGLWPNRIFDHTVSGSDPMILYQFVYEQLTARYNSAGKAETRRLRAPAPPEEITPPSGSQTEFGTRFHRDERGAIQQVEHGKLEALGFKPFSAVQIRYDRSGNPVMERRIHQGGFTRVRQYDFANRVRASLDGHVVDLNAGVLPDTNLDVGGSAFLDPVANNIPHQARRTYNLDTVDNIEKYKDFVSGSMISETKLSIADDNRNVVDSATNSNTSSLGSFSYTQMGWLSKDDTKKVKYTYNYRGQIIKVRDSANTVLRRMEYDCFGRMVLQVDFPGDPQARGPERGTIFVPNIGFGGDGQGADCAAEVTYRYENDYAIAVEIIQHTYGLGAVGGGIGRKRVMELVAYCEDAMPHYRFLHEDSLGSTIATTSAWGDRLAEYDYTEYGAPLHAPVALDGRWISGISRHGSWQTTHADISVVGLSGGVTMVNELVGCELRLVNRTSLSDGLDMYLVATVIGHTAGALVIHDPGYLLADGWADSEKHLAAVYDLREGMVKGVMDSAASAMFQGNGWAAPPNPSMGVAVQEIIVDTAPFDSSWMLTWAPGTSIVPYLEKPVNVKLGPGPAGPTDFVDTIVVGTATGPSGLFTKLLVLDIGLTDYVGPGKWYFIDGNRDVAHASQSGTWDQAATAPVSAPTVSGGAPSGLTVFSPHPFSAISEQMVGWILQPNINVQAYAPIVDVDVQNHQLSVGGKFDQIAQQGVRYRIFAPPGVRRTQQNTGTLDKFVAAQGTRCLYAGYRWESPYAGWQDFGITEWLATEWRQEKNNFTGLYYTLHRHYDPWLMRFTSPDPIASPFYNLYTYTGGNPAAFYDPDGLDPFRELKDMEDEAYYHSEDFDEDDFLTEKYEERSTVRQYERVSKAASQGVTDATAGATYGGANALTVGIFGAFVSPEQHAARAGANADSPLFKAGWISAEVGVSLVMMRGAAVPGRVAVRQLAPKIAARAAENTLVRAAPSPVNRAVGSRNPIGWIGDKVRGWRLAREHSRVTRQVDLLLKQGDEATLISMGAGKGHVNTAVNSVYAPARATARGNVIDYIAKARVRDMQKSGAWGFSKLKVNGSRGADFENLVTGRAWDMTTRGAWGRHVNRYVHPGMPFGNRQLFPLIH